MGWSPTACSRRFPAERHFPAQDITVGARLAKTQFQYTLTDSDLNELNHWSAIFLDKLKGIQGITGVTTDQEDPGPRLNVTVDREVASSFGILPSAIDNTLDDAFGQRIVSTIFTSLNQYHVVLEVLPRFQTGPTVLQDIYLNSSNGQQVPLSTLTKSAITAAPIVINHQGMFPSTKISAASHSRWSPRFRATRMHSRRRCPVSFSGTRCAHRHLHHPGCAV